MVKINYNMPVKVKLTDEGIKIFKMEFGYEPPIDENGFYEDSLWYIMRLFGTHMRLGQLSFFADGCVHMNEEDLN